MPKVFTAGYAGLSIDEFIDLLESNKIETLIDLREIPVSRKKGFSKTAMMGHLKSAGIEYVHFRPLGSPMALRHKVREDRDYTSFFSGVHKHLESPLSRAALEAVLQIINSSKSCLMCFCEDWSHCHRRCVVENLEGRFPVNFNHLRESKTPLTPALPLRRRAA